VQGGSTLTQQLMKNFFLTSKRDWHRKVKEALMSYIAERQYSKDEILENYINDIYLGQRGQEGIYGIWEASEFFFSKEPRDLTIAEMATIAGMIRSPNRYNPIRHANAARQRRNEVLSSMLQDGYVSKAAFDMAVTEPIRAEGKQFRAGDAPFVLRAVTYGTFRPRADGERFPDRNGPGVKKPISGPKCLRGRRVHRAVRGDVPGGARHALSGRRLRARGRATATRRRRRAGAGRAGRSHPLVTAAPLVAVRAATRPACRRLRTRAAPA